MKFIVSSTLLLSHLQTISRVINSKNSMAILDNFLFRLEGTRLSMTASDQETTMTTAIDVMEAEGEGVFAVNAKILTSIPPKCRWILLRYRFLSKLNNYLTV